jgi:hypothetical protein
MSSWWCHNKDIDGIQQVEWTQKRYMQLRTDATEVKEGARFCCPTTGMLTTHTAHRDANVQKVPCRTIIMRIERV